MQKAWDRASKVYLERRGHDVASISYGNLAPTEDTLQLLGDLHGKRILDIGCGGGQNAIACALGGASVVGLDLSVAQLMAARKLAEAHEVDIEWRVGNGQLLNAIPGPFDLILTLQLLPYISMPDKLLSNAASLLKAGGKLVASFDHPFRNCFYDMDADDLSPFPTRAYFDEEPLSWHFEPDLPMQAHHFSLGRWIAWILQAGLILEKVIEAPAPLEICDELWPQDSPLAPIRLIPHTVILVAGRGD